MAWKLKGRMVFKSKFRAIKVTTEDGTFDSKGEYKRWLALREEERQCGIQNLERQVVFPLYASMGYIRQDGTRLPVEGATQLIGDFTADFMYLRDGVLVVEDFKSEPTLKDKHFQRTKRLFEVCYSHPLTISTAKGTTAEYSKQRASKWTNWMRKKQQKALTGTMPSSHQDGE
jgi:hypothetical protein